MDALSLLRQVQQRGVVSWQAFMAAAVMLRLSVTTVLRGIAQRLEPKACYGAAPLIIQEDWAVRLNTMQSMYLRSLLDLDKPVPRFHLLQETGQSMRRSATITARVAGLAAKLALLPKDHICACVAHGNSWTCWVQELLDQCGIPQYRTGQVGYPQFPARLRICACSMREVIKPALAELEA